MKYVTLFAITLAFLVSASALSMDGHGDGSITIPIWPKDASSDLSGELVADRGDGATRITNITAPSMTVFPADKTDGPTPAVLIFPGGAYRYVVYDKEGTEIAEWLNTLGITAIVVKYTAPNNREAAHRDGQRAMRLVRQNADKWNIDPNNVGAFGVSAGGHLSARLSTSFDTDSYEPIDSVDTLSSRPDFNILLYPGLLRPGNDQALADDLPVSAETPPTFIVQTQDDSRLIVGTKLYDQELKKAGVPSVFHFFKQGGHGYGMRPTGQDVDNWPMLCEAWLRASGIIKLR